MRRSFVKLLVIAIAAFLLGMLFRTRSVGAQGTSAVHIYEVTEPKNGSVVGPVLGHVVGFTCNADEETGLPDCWVLTQEP